MRAAVSPKERRIEADVVRLEAERLASGLYRHKSIKFIFELGKYAR